MALKIRGKTVASEELEFGVALDNGFVHQCEDEDEAQFIAALTAGDLRVREVYTTAWGELAE